MATTLSSPSVSISIKAQLAAGAAPAPIASQINHTPNTPLVAGTAAGQVNCSYSAAFTVTNGTPYTLNLLTALDPLGNAVDALHVVSICIENDSVTTGQDFTVGGGTHPFITSEQDTVPANGGAFLKHFGNGIAVVASTNDTITLTVAAGTSVAGKITVLGRQA